MAGKPKISVCIPTHNQAVYLGEALNSVLTQTLQDFEIIIYDDASTDNTQEVLENFRDTRIRSFRQTRNAGIARNRNSCLEAARGEYIAWLDSDDIYHPEMLALQSSVLDRNPNIGLVHAAYEVVDHDGRKLPDWPLPFTCDMVESGREAFRELIISNYVTAPTTLVRHACHDKVGPYATDIGRSSTDWEMWLRLALVSDIA
nr:glycosyltransferase family 2 protein [Acidobacteriota bacterium]